MGIWFSVWILGNSSRLCTPLAQGAPGSQEHTQGCANSHRTIPELSLASSSSRRGGTSTERTVLVTPIPQRGPGQRQSSRCIYRWEKFQIHTFCPRSKAKGFPPESNSGKNSGSPRSRHTCRAFLLFFFCSLRAASWAFLFSASLLAWGETPETSVRAGQGLQPPSPTKAPGARGGWTPQHQDQGWDTGSSHMAPRGHRELCPTIGQPGDTGRDLNTFTRDREVWKKQVGLGRARPRV